MGLFDELAKCIGFNWDEGNHDKNWRQHHVTDSECEQVFFNEPLVASKDHKHTARESRYFTLGQTDAGRLLFVAFTIRKNCIRVISARDMTRRERRKYKE